MKKRPQDDAPPPLPREWLSPPLPPEGDTLWNARAGRILDAARPELRRLERAARPNDVTSWRVMVRWWRPAALLATAASALLVFAGRPAASPGPVAGAALLSLVASDADPVALWAVAGVAADPVLARIAFLDASRPDAPGTRAPAATLENR